MRKMISAGLALVWTLSGVAPFAAAQTAGSAAPPVADPNTPTVVIKADKPATRRRASQWFRAESEHFIVYSDADRKDVAAVIGKLERFRYVLRSYLRQDTTAETAEPKLELYYLSHEQDIDIAHPNGPMYSIGLYQGCEDGTQAYAVHMYYDDSSTQPLEKRPENEGLNYIFEAYARHYLYQTWTDKQPTWFIDGFAHYFSTTRFDGNEAIVGMAPAAMARYLNLVGNMTTYSLDYKDVLRQAETNGHSVLPGVDGVKVEYQTRSWLLVHYILSTPENRQKFGVYMKAVNGGADPVKAFQTAFGISAGQIDNVLWNYRRLHLEALKVMFKSLPEADINFETLPASADKLLMWQSELKACPDARYAPGLLSNIRSEAKKYPSDPLAQRILSRAEATLGEPNAAIPFLTQSTADASYDSEAFYLLGRAQLSLAMKSMGEARAAALKAARQAFAKASTIDPKSATTAWYYYRTVVLETGKPDEDAQAAALIAWQQAPEIDTFALHAGFMYAWLGRKDEALQALKTVADNPRGRELQPVAKAWMAKIQAGTDQASLLAAMQADYPTPKGGLDEWTIATADVVQAVKDAADTADATAALSAADPAETPQTTTASAP
jgi:hypothetical protein